MLPVCRMSVLEHGALFDRLAQALERIDPRRAARRSPLTEHIEDEGLRTLYAGAGGLVPLDGAWELVPPRNDERTGRIAFASDGGERSIEIDPRTREVVLSSMDPPAERLLAADLGTWLTELVERAESEARALPPSHTATLALHDAIERDDLAAVTRALEGVADPEARPNNTSALELAVEMAKSLEMLRLLLEGGAKAANGSWCPPLFRVFGSWYRPDREKVVELLLDHGADPNSREPYYGRPALTAAAASAELAVVRLLVTRGADVNARITLGTGVNAQLSVGETALAVACRRTRLLQGKDTESVALYLLDRGADPNLPNETTGETPLTLAIRRRNARLVEGLLAAGADPNLSGRWGQTALDVANDTLTFSRRVPVDDRIVAMLRARGARAST